MAGWLTFYNRQLIAWLIRRLVTTGTVSLALMTGVAVVVGVVSWVTSNTSVSLLTNLSGLVFVGFVGYSAGVLASPIVAVLVFRRRPRITVSVVYAILFVIMFDLMPPLWSVGNVMLDTVIKVTQSVALLSLGAALFWAVWDVWRGNPIWAEFHPVVFPNQCGHCGYTLYSSQVERCSECGTPHTPA